MTNNPTKRRDWALIRGAAGLAAIVGLFLWFYWSGGRLPSFFHPPEIEDPTGPHEIMRIRVSGFINAVAWNPDGSRLAILSNFGSDITLLDATTWRTINKFQRTSGPYSANSLAFSSEDALLTSTPMGDDAVAARQFKLPRTDPKYTELEIFSLIEWNPETGKRIRFFPDPIVSPPVDQEPRMRSDTFAVSPDRTLIAAIDDGGDRSRVLLYEIKSGVLLHTLQLPQLSSEKVWARSLAFSPVSAELAVGSYIGGVQFFDVHTGQPTRAFLIYPNDEYFCSSLAYSPDGKSLAVGKSISQSLPHETLNSVDIFLAETGALQHSLSALTAQVARVTQTNPVSTLSWSPSGETLAIGDGRSLRVWRVTGPEPKLLFSRRMSLGTFSTAYSPDGKLAASDNDEVVIYR